MDKEKISILKFIQSSRDNNSSIWWGGIQKEGYNIGLVKHMIHEGLIHGKGIFALTSEGSKILREYLLIEATNNQQKIKEKYMLDSNVFDDIVSGKLKFELILKYQEKTDMNIYLTHIQNDEIQSCKDEEKRKKLTLFVLKVRPIIIPTETLVVGTSRLGEAKLGNGDVFTKIKGENIKHTGDALIGETAIKNNLILVTNDKILKSKVENEGGLSLFVDNFINRLSNKNE